MIVASDWYWVLAKQRRITAGPTTVIRSLGSGELSHKMVEIRV